VISRSGALVTALQALGAGRAAIVTPYMEPLTDSVAGYLASHSIEVVDRISLAVPDNVEVGRLDPTRLPEIAARLDVSRAQAIVLSACVQMPSLEVLEPVEEQLGLPTLSTATATAREVVRRLGIDAPPPPPSSAQATRSGPKRPPRAFALMTAMRS